MVELKIVEATAQMLKEYSDFYSSNLNEAVKHEADYERLLRAQKNGIKYYFVEKANGERIGTFSLSFTYPLRKLLKLAVSEPGILLRAPWRITPMFGGLSIVRELRAKGLEGGLLKGITKLAEGEARRLGAKKLYISVNEGNPNWKRLGERAKRKKFGDYVLSRRMTAKKALRKKLGIQKTVVAGGKIKPQKSHVFVKKL